MSADVRPLTPEARLKSPDATPQGYAVPLVDGLVWTLYPVGSLCEDPEVSLIQDELYDALAYEGKISRTLLYRAFHVATRINYDLSDAETAILFFAVDPERRVIAPGGGYLHFSLIQAVLAAVLPSESPADTTYSDWLDSALRINNIDPATVPPERLPAVLGHLVALGRCVPPERFVSAAISGAERNRARSLTVDHAPAPAPPAEPPAE